MIWYSFSHWYFKRRTFVHSFICIFINIKLLNKHFYANCHVDTLRVALCYDTTWNTLTQSLTPTLSNTSFIDSELHGCLLLEFMVFVVMFLLPHTILGLMIIVHRTKQSRLNPYVCWCAHPHQLWGISYLPVIGWRV